MPAPATRPPRERVHDETRERIVAAAWRLAERDGIAGVSLRDLAEQVGMRAPSLYTYFDGKGAIYDEMFAQGYAQLDRALDEVPFDPDDLHGSVTAALTTWLEFCQASLPRYQLLFTRVLPDWEPSEEAYASSVRSYERMVDRLADAGIGGQEALDLFTALTAGLAAQQLANDPGGDRWVRLAPDAVAMFLDHLGLRDRPAGPKQRRAT